mgnify:CR=1 FL=1
MRDPANVVTLGEGDTPLLPAGRLGEHLGTERLWIKDEGLNPTGSFKARGLSAAVSKAKELGAKAIAIPSAGNAASALAAYGAEHPPSREEMALLAAALRFPEDWYRLACRYFLNGGPWPLRTFLRLERRIWAAEAARRVLVKEIPFLSS